MSFYFLNSAYYCMKPFSQLSRSARLRRIRLVRGQVKSLKSQGVSNKFARRLKIWRNSFEVKKLLAGLPEKERVHAERLFSSHADVRFSAVGALRVLFPDDLRWHRLYAGQDPAFFDKERRIVRGRFVKTGSDTFLLGGNLVGKSIVRVISRNAFAGWKKAFDAGISVEPILKGKNDRLRFREIMQDNPRKGWKKGEVLVFSKVLGLSVEDFLSVSENRQRFESVVREQQKKIESDLTRLSIKHGHLHDNNFCIHWEKDSAGKRFPKVYLIDFDLAVSK